MKRQKGAVSIFIVLFATMLFVAISIGFAIFMMRDQDRATDNDLSNHDGSLDPRGAACRAACLAGAFARLASGASNGDGGGRPAEDSFRRCKALGVYLRPVHRHGAVARDKCLVAAHVQPQFQGTERQILAT